MNHIEKLDNRLFWSCFSVSKCWAHNCISQSFFGCFILLGSTVCCSFLYCRTNSAYKSLFHFRKRFASNWCAVLFLMFDHPLVSFYFFFCSCWFATFATFFLCAPFGAQTKTQINFSSCWTSTLSVWAICRAQCGKKIFEKKSRLEKYQ